MANDKTSNTEKMVMANATPETATLSAIAENTDRGELSPLPTISSTTIAEVAIKFETLNVMK